MRALSETGLRWWWLALVTIVLDQVSKWLAVSYLDYGYPGVEITPFFNLVHVYNPGAAFSFLADQGGWQRWFFAGLAAAVTVLLSRWMYTSPRSARWLPAAYALIIGGAIGNVIDRLLLGHVVDFLDFYAGNWHWPAFNLADSFIFIGAAMIIIDSFKKDSPQ
ncbi:signal peptidase II [Oceanimonas baumannii]|uniref:Lipoprotein signal peptidase n=1 Tax=Oceanimonas baumannii TaxID=129578 RepID=A0A235CJL9_9GAMM|nr:signal peptidase II [Oceanimonas baumannii]MCC4265704.1 signal peptidase II [Oceanimonas baumannii]OYD24730.1 signal peptidase II [Oceanimonas baumannii]TDW59479.1 signal peptidase II [Oceanimonas baumannii]